MRPQIKTGDRVRFRTDGEIGELNRQQRTKEQRNDYYIVIEVYDENSIECQPISTQDNDYAVFDSPILFDICNDFSDIAVGDEVEVCDGSICPITDVMKKWFYVIHKDCEGLCLRQDGKNNDGAFPYLYALRIVKKAKPESPIDLVEQPLRTMILRAREEGKNIRSYYQDMVFTPYALTNLLADGKFRWWNIINWHLTDREQNYYPQVKLTEKPLLADAKVGDLCKRRDGKWVQVMACDGGVTDQPIEYSYGGRLISVTINGIYNPGCGNAPDDIIEHQPLAPEGTSEWAWQMMLLGKRVRHESYTMPQTHLSVDAKNRICIHTTPSSMKDGGDPICHVNDWITSRQVDSFVDERIGWQLYADPRFEVGEFVKDEYGKLWIVEANPPQSGSYTTYKDLYCDSRIETGTSGFTHLPAKDVILDFGNGIKGTIEGSIPKTWIHVRRELDWNTIASVFVPNLTDPMRSMVEALLARQEEEK